MDIWCELGAWISEWTYGRYGASISFPFLFFYFWWWIIGCIYELYEDWDEYMEWIGRWMSEWVLGIWLDSLPILHLAIQACLRCVVMCLWPNLMERGHQSLLNTFPLPSQASQCQSIIIPLPQTKTDGISHNWGLNDSMVMWSSGLQIS